MERRKFLKSLLLAPAIATIGVVDTKGKDENKPPKVLLVDPYQVNMNDLMKIDCPELKGTRIVRLRRPYWGQGLPIQRIF